MSLPESVIQVKDNLKSQNHPLAELMSVLTEPKEMIYLEYYAGMWQSVMNASKNARVTFLGDDWIISFLNAVNSSAVDLPYYSYVGAKKKKADIAKVWKYTKGLQSLYKNVDFEDERGDQGRTIIKELQSYAEEAEKKILDASRRGKNGERSRAITFIRALSESNMLVYGDRLNSVVRISAYALYGVEYKEDSSITNLINRGWDPAEAFYADNFND